MSLSYDLGVKGEQKAVELLLSKGYCIIKRNYRYEKAEVDIICQIGNDLVFVEVKTRSTDFFGDPADSVGHKKIKMLAMAADHFVKDFKLNLEVRFDIISVIYSDSNLVIDHIENAFYPFENL